MMVVLGGGRLRQAGSQRKEVVVVEGLFACNKDSRWFIGFGFSLRFFSIIL